jgi:DNA-binding transcriptional ArsR family regulator
LVNFNITHVDPSQSLKEVLVAAKRKFTRIPKVQDLILAGVPTEMIPTYCALSDYTNNKTGLCWPKMETLASTLCRSVRTIQRHLHQLQDLGLVEFIERRRWRGRYSSYTYRVLHIAQLIRSRRKRASTTGHGVPVERGNPIFTGTKAIKIPPYNPPKEAFNWFFGKQRNLEAEEQHHREQAARRSEASRRRSEGYEWLFGNED